MSDSNDSKLVSLSAIRKLKRLEEMDYDYQLRISLMEKHELLDEMIRFQKERSREGKLTLNMITRGKVLFQALEKSAETQALQILARSYQKHLTLELQNYLQDETYLTKRVSDSEA